MRYDFNEINILKQNLYNNKQQKQDFQRMLNNIYENTEDPILRDSLQSLMKKISVLSQSELSLLCDDILQKRLIATMTSPITPRNKRGDGAG